jgi:hypothetical protein
MALLSTLPAAAFAVVIALAAAPPAEAGAATPNACQRTHSQALTFSNPARPDTLVVSARSTRADCKDTKVTVVVRNAAGRMIWTESAVLSLVDFGRFPDEDGVELSPGDVARAVDNWVSIEKASDAPPWSTQAAALVAPSDDPQQFDTALSQAAYLRIRAAGGPMLCIGVGPESAHCIAIDPATRKPAVLFNRGL